MNIFNIFPNPIFVENCPHKKLIETYVKNELQKTALEKDANSENLFHIKNELQSAFLRNDTLEIFNLWVTECCNYFVTDIIGYNLESGMTMTNSWLNICNEGGFQVPHIHTNSYISGTYYVNIEDKHAPLNFRHQQVSPHATSPTISLEKKSIQPTLYNSDATFFPQSGQLYLWQSHLSHGYFNNKKDGRISISMNFLPKKIINGNYGFEISPII